MRPHRITAYLRITLFLILIFISTAPSFEAKSEGLFQTDTYPPRPPVETVQQARPLAEPLSTLELPKDLKAVLLVGPIDGNQGSWTLDEIANMERTASVLEANEVEVHRFYPGTGTFEEIETAATGAHFLLYRGHGVYDGNLPSPHVGGFALSSGYYSPDRIRTNLHLAPNAIVMIYGCFAAGSSSAEGDQYDIGITEASRRVAEYSDPFFDIGASGYYSNWYGDAFQHFLSNLFAGQTLGEAYENFYDFNHSTVYRTNHPDHPSLSMWIDKDNWGYWKYNNAFAGKNNQTLASLFHKASLWGIPEEVNFVVDVGDTISVNPPTYVVTPKNISGNEPIEWSLSQNGDWFEVSATQGKSPSSSFVITPKKYTTSEPRRYTGTITVTATNPPDTQNPVQTISVNLEVKVPQLGNLPSQINFVYSIPARIPACGW